MAIDGWGGKENLSTKGLSCDLFPPLCGLPEQLNFLPIEHFLKYDASFQR